LRVHQPCIERVVVPDEISRREIRRIVVTVGLAGSAANDFEQGRPVPRRDFIGEPSVSRRRLRLAGTKTTPNNSSRQLLQITKCMFPLGQGNCRIRPHDSFCQPKPTFEQRLAQEAHRVKERAKTLPQGKERELLSPHQTSSGRHTNYRPLRILIRTSPPEPLLARSIRQRRKGKGWAVR
jgi:hypothetical protein